MHVLSLSRGEITILSSCWAFLADIENSLRNFKSKKGWNFSLPVMPYLCSSGRISFSSKISSAIMNKIKYYLYCAKTNYYRSSFTLSCFSQRTAHPARPRPLGQSLPYPLFRHGWAISAPIPPFLVLFSGRGSDPKAFYFEGGVVRVQVGLYIWLEKIPSIENGGTSFSPHSMNGNFPYRLFKGIF
jgi:hypothetical protein